jgi:hypothetical protein
VFDRNEQEISLIIEESLEAILAGKASLGEVLRQHPDLAATLQPELEAALWLVARKEQVEPRPGFVTASRRRVVERVRQESRSRGTKRAFLGFLPAQPRTAFQWVAAVVALVLLVSGMGGILTVSQGALPGDQLYSVKRISEEVALGLTLNEVRKVDLSAEYTGRRVQEVEALITRGNYATVPETLDDFEQAVNHAVTLLQQVDDGQLQEKGALASQIHQDLTEYAERLDALKLSAPEVVHASLERARDVSTSGASLATEVFEDVLEETMPGTATPVVVDTSTPAPTEPRARETVQPGDTPPDVIPPAETPQPPVGDDEPVQTEPAPDSEEPEKTRTPKPTNENRPEKPTSKPTDEPKPPGENQPTDKPQPPDEKKPTDPPKPPKEERPTDKPKPTNVNKPTDRPKPTKEIKPTKTE